MRAKISMKHRVTRMIFSFILAAAGLVAIVAAAAVLFMQQPKFGKLPEGTRLARIEQSPHYRDGKFHNLEKKPDLSEGVTTAGITWDFLFRKKERPRPAGPLPSQKTDLLLLPEGKNLLVWLGHSSCFLLVGGKTVLVDPHLSPNASPLSFTTRAFAGTRPYTAADLPPADYVLLTHDHWDHLDYETILAIKDTAGTFICGLGVGGHLERWGVPPEKIVETDWGDVTNLSPGFTVRTLTAHHFSGRTFRRDQVLWASFLLETPAMRLYFGGDSGYGPHFAAIGETFGPVDLAILENGQYDANWKYTHMQPEDVLRAARDLRAKALLPVHSGKFEIANHPWDEPLRRITALSGDTPRLLTPMIGESVDLDDAGQTFSRWWEGLE